MTFPINVRERVELLCGWGMPWREAMGAHYVTYPLVASDGGRTRLERWVRAGCPVPDLGQARVLAGEPATHAEILRTLGRLPACVQWHTCRNTMIVSIGPRCAGWQDLLPIVEIVDEPKQLIVLAVGVGDDEGRAAVLAHEIAHGWLAVVAQAAPTWEALAKGRDHAQLFARLAGEWNMRPEALKPVQDEERRACRLAAAWRFRGYAADPDRCAATARLAGE